MVIKIWKYILANFTAIFHFNTPSKCQSTVWAHFQGILKWRISVKWVNTPTFPVFLHWVKKVRIRGFSGPYFPTFGLSTERYSVQIRIQSKCRKMRTRKTPKTDTFHAVLRPICSTRRIGEDKFNLLDDD